MTTVYLGKAEGYSTQEGFTIHVNLLQNPSISVDGYIRALADTVRENKIRQVVLEGENILSLGQRPYLESIMGLLRSLRVPVDVIVDTKFSETDILNIKSLFDASYTNIIIRLAVSDIYEPDALKNVSTFMNSCTSQQNFIGQAIFDTAAQASTIFLAMAKLDIQKVITDFKNQNSIEKAAIINNIELCSETVSEIYMIEENGQLKMHDNMLDVQIAA